MLGWWGGRAWKENEGGSLVPGCGWCRVVRGWLDNLGVLMLAWQCVARAVGRLAFECALTSSLNVFEGLHFIGPVGARYYRRCEDAFQKVVSGLYVAFGIATQT